MGTNQVAHIMTPEQTTQIIIALVGVVATIVGVIAGFCLQEWKEKIQVRRKLRQVKEELRANFHILSLKRPILEQMIAALKAGKVLPGESVRCISSFYENEFASVRTHLSDLECNSIHVIHERLRILDEFMDGYEPKVKELIATFRDAIAGVAAAKTTILPKLQDILESVSETQQLIKKHLNGNPEDVLHVKTGEF